MDFYQINRIVLRLASIILTALLLNACINLPPVPEAGNTQNAMVGDTIYLSASSSWDVNSDDLSYVWNFNFKPEFSNAEFVDNEVMEVDFFADIAGEYVIELAVSDGKYTTYDYVSIFIDDPNASNPAQEHIAFDDACLSCHNNTDAKGKPDFHLPSSDNCELCHTTKKWMPSITVNHTEVFGECKTCHNGTMSIGKTVSHLATTANCSACHDTSQWLPAIHVEHAEVLGECRSCHNTTLARGMPDTHSDIGDKDCGECHTVSLWNPQTADI